MTLINRHRRTAWPIVMLLAGLVIVGTNWNASGATWTIQNPYAEVDWEQTGRYKASLHTHTLASDGKLFPHEVIDGYQELDYDVLAITDHNKVSYPWTNLSQLYGEGYENRDPKTVGMLDVEGNELSRHHHMGSYWNAHEGTTNEVESLKATLALGGQTVLFHPGRYKQPVQWYVDLYEQFDHLTGMEVYNQGDRYPGDRGKWDAVLSVVMPDRPVWGFSNDDMHVREHLGRNWNIFLLPALNEEEVRRGIKDGLFFFVYAPKGHAGAAPPVIESFTVDQQNGIIQATVSGHSRLEWISDGKVVSEQATLRLNEATGLGSYVRLMVYGEDDTVVGTQPFGLRPVME